MWTSFGYLNTIGYAKHLFPIVMVRALGKRPRCSCRAQAALRRLPVPAQAGWDAACAACVRC